MLKNFLFIFLMLGVQSMFAEQIRYVKINNVDVPVISEKSSVIPTGHVEIVFIGGGNMFNPPNQPLATISSMFLNRGTKKLGNIRFAELLESKAVDLHASVNNSTLSFELDFLKEYEDFAYNQLRDLILDPNLTESTLQDIRKNLHASFMNNSTNFDYQATILLNKSIFSKTPLAYPAIGNSVKEIDSVDLNHVKQFLDSVLVLENMIIVIGGDLDIDKSLLKLQNSLKSLSKGKKVTLRQYAVKSAPMKVVRKDTQQAYIYFASPLYISDIRKDGYKAQVAGFILGSSGFGSRLMEEIRVKRGLAYSAYMRPNVSKISNYSMGYMQTSLDKQDEAINLTKKILQDFVENGVTQKELDSAKKFLLGYKPLQEETLEQRLGAKFSNYYNGLPLDYKDEFIKKVQELDLQTLNEFIKSHKEIAQLTFAVITK